MKKFKYYATMSGNSTTFDYTNIKEAIEEAIKNIFSYPDDKVAVFGYNGKSWTLDGGSVLTTIITDSEIRKIKDKAVKIALVEFVK